MIRLGIGGHMTGWKRWATFATCLVVAVLMYGSAGHTQDRPRGEQGPSTAPDSATLAKEALAEGMISQNESIHARQFAPDLRSSLKGNLMALSGNALAALNPMLPSFLPAVMGDSGEDLVFTPVNPCRVINFVRINPGVNPSFDIATLCGIPFGPATSVAMNIIAVDPAGNGDLRMFPFGGAVPLASVINYGFPGTGFNIANGLVVPICNPNLVGCAD